MMSAKDCQSLRAKKNNKWSCFQTPTWKNSQNKEITEQKISSAKIILDAIKRTRQEPQVAHTSASDSHS